MPATERLRAFRSFNWKQKNNFFIMRRNFKFEKTLRNDQWEKLEHTFPEIFKKNYRRHNVRLFIDAVLWVTGNNTAWNYLPEKYGSKTSIYSRFCRWSEEEIWHSLALKFGDDNELKALFGSVVERADLFIKAKEYRNLNGAEG
ncbi:transposase [Collimonas humicola]|uniref:transposase n=1 Tax=Collimonas humicola TaxID=2825886 RepID=UPI001B8C704C|nr:transposase [Collimonas humicola]